MKKTDQGMNLLKTYADKAKIYVQKLASSYTNNAKMLLVGMASFFATQQAGATPKTNNSDKEDFLIEETSNIKTNSPNKDRYASFTLDNEKQTLKVGGVYKGVYMKFRDIEAADIGHLFESGMNPYAKGKGGKYLGLYQMDTGATMQSFIFGAKNKDGSFAFKGVAKEYPELARLGMTAAQRQNKAFQTMFGDLSKTAKFRHRMDKYMQDVKYKPVFDALRQVPGLDFDKRNEVFHGSVMTAINQNSSPNVIVGIFSEALKKAQEVAKKEDREASTQDIIKYSYLIRTQKWGLNLKGRYQEENRLCQDLLAFKLKMEEIKSISLEKDQRIRANMKMDSISKGSIIANIEHLKNDATRLEISPTFVPQSQTKSKKNVNQNIIQQMTRRDKTM